ncbi:MAG: Ig-like domain repeat protein [Capsulimonadaceae bacterium]|nr:Ig-like domain repeat protein [Capsulimonadaceae bacterium]
MNRPMNVTFLAILMTLLAAPFANPAPVGYVALPGHVRPLPAGAKYVGSVAETEPIALGIALPNRNREALDTLIKRIYDPKDVLYGEYLTPEAFAEGYGPTQADYDDVKSWLSAQGFNVTKEFSNRHLIMVAGTASVVESAFNVRLSRYESLEGRKFRALDANPSLPAALAPKIQEIEGLDSSVEAAPAIIKRTTFVREPATGTFKGFGPVDWHNCYNLDSASLTASGLPSNLDGAGQTVMLLEWGGGGCTPSDIAGFTNYFASYFGSQYSAPLLQVFGPYDSYSGGDPETTLDVCCILDLAPKVSRIVVYVDSDGADACFTNFATDTVDTGTGKLADVGSTSWMYKGETADQSEYDILAEIAAQGQSIYSAAGDWGVYWKDDVPEVSNVVPLDPNTQPYITSVGGSTVAVTSNGAWSNEVVFNQMSNSSADNAGGGGISTAWSIPWYQSTYIPASNASGYSTTMRNYPDVTLAFFDYAICLNGKMEEYGGTSAAAPMWAGFTALVNQELKKQNKADLGFANPSLYRLASTSHYSSDFHDIVKGNNGPPSGAAAAGAYTAAAGYDLCSGWGSFNGANLIRDLAATTNTTTTALAASLDSLTYGDSITFTATVGETVPDGETVTFFNGSASIGQAKLTGAKATITTTTLTAGSDTITAVYGGDASFASSTSNAVEVTVNQQNTVTKVVSSLNPTTYGNSVTFTATVSPKIPDGESVEFYDGADSIGTGTLTGSVASFTTSTLNAGSHNIIAYYIGDTNYVPSGSTTLAQVVSSISTNIVVTTTTNPSTSGTPIVFTAAVSPSVPDGETVTFTSDNSVTDGQPAGVMGTGTTSGGSATLTLTEWGNWLLDVVATYPGDGNYAPCTSSTYKQVVVTGTTPTATVLDSSENPSTYGDDVEYTATVSPDVPDDEPIVFWDGGTVIDWGWTYGGSATIDTYELTAGIHNISATYFGDASYAGSSASLSNQIVYGDGWSATTTTLQSSLNPSGAGASVTFTANVGPTVPDGESVTFYDGASLIGSGLTSGGSASLSTTALSLGDHTITATYIGDYTYAPSTSSKLTQAVKNATAASLSSSANPSAAGNPVTFTASLSPSVPDGEVITFQDGSAVLGTSKTAASAATLTTSSMTAASHTVTAVYSGDATYGPCTSNVVTQVVTAATATSLASSMNPSSFGALVTLTATVTPSVPDGETVTFYDGGKSIGTGSTVASVVSLATSALAAGSHAITASYAGDTVYLKSTSTALTQSVNKGSVTTTIVSSVNPSTFGSPVTFTATLSPNVPDGETVTFDDGGTSIGTGTMSGSVATLTTSALSAGSHTVTAAYPGDANLAASTSSPLAQFVTQLGPSYPAGLNFFSSPYDYPGIGLDALLGYKGVKLAVFSPADYAYFITPNGPAGSIRLGVGYWGRFPQAVTFASQGTPAPANTAFEIGLSAGWNMIGDPFTKSIGLSSLTFGPLALSFSQATSGVSPIVSGAFWSYSSTSNSYTAASSLDAQKAYWVYAYSDTTMYVPAD